jgi:hypothetical protein
VIKTNQQAPKRVNSHPLPSHLNGHLTSVDRFMLELGRYCHDHYAGPVSTDNTMDLVRGILRSNNIFFTGTLPFGELGDVVDDHLDKVSRTLEESAYDKLLGNKYPIELLKGFMATLRQPTSEYSVAHFEPLNEIGDITQYQH